jgi:uncharacterized protein
MTFYTISIFAKPSWCSFSHLNKTERTICANKTLSDLDNRLAKVYGANKAKNSDNEQIEWLKKRNKCGSDISCIKKEYNNRINFLKERFSKNEDNYVNLAEDQSSNQVKDKDTSHKNSITRLDMFKFISNYKEAISSLNADKFTSLFDVKPNFDGKSTTKDKIKEFADNILFNKEIKT